MPNVSTDQNAKRNKKYRSGKKLREKLTKTLVDVKIEDCEPEPVTNDVRKVPKEIFERQELGNQELRNQAEAKMKLSKEVHQKSTENLPGTAKVQ